MRANDPLPSPSPRPWRPAHPFRIASTRMQIGGASTLRVTDAAARQLIDTAAVLK
jgi:hypothetical protein